MGASFFDLGLNQKLILTGCFWDLHLIKCVLLKVATNSKHLLWKCYCQGFWSLKCDLLLFFQFQHWARASYHSCWCRALHRTGFLLMPCNTNVLWSRFNVKVSTSYKYNVKYPYTFLVSIVYCCLSDDQTYPATLLFFCGSTLFLPLPLNNLIILFLSVTLLILSIPVARWLKI